VSTFFFLNFAVNVPRVIVSDVALAPINHPKVPGCGGVMLLPCCLKVAVKWKKQGRTIAK
jgi:hypothetical protein